MSSHEENDLGDYLYRETDRQSVLSDVPRIWSVLFHVSIEYYCNFAKKVIIISAISVLLLQTQHPTSPAPAPAATLAQSVIAAVSFVRYRPHRTSSITSGTPGPRQSNHSHSHIPSYQALHHMARVDGISHFTSHRPSSTVRRHDTTPISQPASRQAGIPG